jgi:hypothetical protein
MVALARSITVCWVIQSIRQITCPAGPQDRELRRTQREKMKMNRYPHVPHSRKLRWIAVVGAFGALTACSSDSTPTPSVTAATAGVDSRADKAGDPAASDARLRASAIANGIITSRDACALLTRSDAEASVGQLLPQNSRNITLGQCDYNAVDFSAGAGVTVGSWESIRGAATSGQATPTTIAGVGDEALNLNGSNGSNLYVRRGDEGFLLTLHGPKIDSLQDHGLTLEQALALRILAKF